MANSVVGIYNMALVRMGHSVQVSALGEGSAEEVACSTFYEQCRDIVLQDWPWGFARRNVLLAQLASTSAETAADAFPRNWGFKYAYPSDCLHIHELVHPGVRVPGHDQRIPYEVLNDGANKAIYTDAEDAEMVYYAKVSDVTKWDPMAISALVYLLAAEVAPSLSRSKEVDRLMKGYYQTANAGAARDMNEGFQREPDSELERSRA